MSRQGSFNVIPPMLNIALFGPPGAGKGTQSQWLAADHSLAHIAPGDLFREAVRRQTDLGRKAQAYMESGRLVPGEVTIALVGEVMSQSTANSGFLLDGYPRSLEQAEALDQQLAARGSTLHAVLFLEVSHEAAIARLQLRRHAEGRVDDQDDARILARFRQYEEALQPIASYYEQQRKLIRIAGDLSVEEVKKQIQEQISALDVLQKTSFPTEGEGEDNTLATSPLFV